MERQTRSALMVIFNDDHISAIGDLVYYFERATLQNKELIVRFFNENTRTRKYSLESPPSGHSLNRVLNRSDGRNKFKKLWNDHLIPASDVLWTSQELKCFSTMRRPVVNFVCLHGVIRQTVEFSIDVDGPFALPKRNSPGSFQVYARVAVYKLSPSVYAAVDTYDYDAACKVFANLAELRKWIRSLRHHTTSLQKLVHFESGKSQKK